MPMSSSAPSCPRCPWVASLIPSPIQYVAPRSLSPTSPLLVMNEERGISAAFGEEVKIVEVVKTVEVIEEVEVVKEDEVIKYIERPRPEVKEMCIQTDELVHTTPPRTSVPISVTPSSQAEHSPSHPLPYRVAYIEGIRAVLDPNPMPPSLYQYSIVILTSHQEMKITALTRERHEIWLNVSNAWDWFWDLVNHLIRLLNTCFLVWIPLLELLAKRQA